MNDRVKWEDSWIINLLDGCLRTSCTNHFNRFKIIVCSLYNEFFLLVRLQRITRIACLFSGGLDAATSVCLLDGKIFARVLSKETLRRSSGHSRKFNGAFIIGEPIRAMLQLQLNGTKPNSARYIHVSHANVAPPLNYPVNCKNWNVYYTPPNSIKI